MRFQESAIRFQIGEFGNAQEFFVPAVFGNRERSADLVLDVRHPRFNLWGDVRVERWCGSQTPAYWKPETIWITPSLGTTRVNEVRQKINF